MARVNTYLNFQGQTQEAFTSYGKTFGTEVTMLSRYSDMPAVGPGELPAEERDLVLHAELPILAGHVLMATDMLHSNEPGNAHRQQHHPLSRRRQPGRGRPLV
jgi:PhnB protein